MKINVNNEIKTVIGEFETLYASLHEMGEQKFYSEFRAFVYTVENHSQYTIENFIDQWDEFLSDYAEECDENETQPHHVIASLISYTKMCVMVNDFSENHGLDFETALEIAECVLGLQAFNEKQFDFDDMSSKLDDDVYIYTCDDMMDHFMECRGISSDLESYLDRDYILSEMGYDYTVIGDGDDRLFVEY